MAEFMGKDGFVWWQGVVEDRYDPLYLGRCRIRILGWHTEDKTDMPTESLPWAYPVQPIISAAQTGVGISPTGPVEGTWVVGFYRDGEQAQEPVFFGTLGGIPSLDAKIPNTEGFADPRGAPEGPVHPQLKSLKKDTPHNILTYNFDDPERNIPYPPVKIKHYLSHTKANTAINTVPPRNKKIISARTGKLGNLAGSVNVVMEEHMTRSTYPRTEHLGEPTTPREARGKAGTPEDEYSSGIHAQKQTNFGLTGGPTGFKTARLEVVRDPDTNVILSQGRGRWREPQPISLYGAVYPYNHVHLSESGHLIEIDDTPNNERLHRYHRTGTYEEIGSLGQRVVKIVNENFHMGLNNDYTSIKGSKYLNISNTLDIVSRGYYHNNDNYPIEFSAGSLSMEFPTSKQTFSINADGITIDANGAPIELKGSSLKKTFTDASQTDTIKGGFTQKVGGIHSMESGSISLASKGSTGITAGGALNVLASGNITETIVNLSLPPAVEARKTTATFGDINFNTANFGIGNFNVDIGPMFPGQPGGTGTLSSFQMTPLGTITISSFAGSTGLFSMTPAGMTLTYGASSISLTAAGVSIVGPTVTVGSSASAVTSVEGVLVNVKATGITTVEGSLVKLN